MLRARLEPTSPCTIIASPPTSLLLDDLKAKRLFSIPVARECIVDSGGVEGREATRFCCCIEDGFMTQEKC